MELNIFELIRALFLDLGVDKKTSLYVMRRLRNEGISVVTVLLPAFSKHVLACIEAGEWSDFGSSVRNYRGLPVIFRGYLLELFTYDSLSSKFIAKQPGCPVALFCLRQACEYAFKLALPFGDSQLADAAAKFAAVDADVFGVGDYDTSFVRGMRANFISHYKQASAVTLEQVAAEAHPGPGTFSGSKSDFWMRNFRAPEVPRAARDLRFGLRWNHRAPNPGINSSDPDYSEVLFVPKDSRGPRTITREPYSSLQFQMGYFTQMTSALEKDTQCRINFVDQTINQRLAHKASIDRQMCTLDLKDASDRVSYAIVDRLFRDTPLSKVIDWFRTKRAKLPDGSFVQLKKLAGMGSGYTFPTMALLIHLAICSHVSQRRNIPYRRVMKHVYVYGDDIIVPTTWYELATAALRKIGLEVNSSKSYFRGPFRESCGGDFYYGNDVAPVRLKLSSAGPRIGPVGRSGTGGRTSNSRQPDKRALSRVLPNLTLAFENRDFAVLGLERHARELVKKQLFYTAELVYRLLEKELGPLPLVTEESAVLGRLASRDDVLNTISYDDTGTAVKRRMAVARPVSGVVSGMCPYRLLKRLVIKDDRNESWKDDLFPAGSLIRWGIATMPRRIVVARRKVSDYART